MTGRTDAVREPEDLPIPVPGDRLLTAEDVALMLGLSRRMVYQLVVAGELRAVRFGRSVRITPASVEAYLRRALA